MFLGIASFLKSAIFDDYDYLYGFSGLAFNFSNAGMIYYAMHCESKCKHIDQQNCDELDDDDLPSYIQQFFNVSPS